MTDATHDTAAEAEAKPKKAPAKKAAAPKAKAPAKKAAAKAPAKKAAAAKAEKPAKKPKAEKAEKPPVDRSAAVSNSWKNGDVAAARNVKNKVKCGGVEYRSVADAFRELKLPMNRHIAFRGELKAAGKATFKNETDGAKYNFSIV